LLLRKYTSIILLFILLFNMIGYRAWFYYAEKKADATMEAQLDSDQYEENDLVSIIIPLDNPYQLEQKSYQHINGEISFQGKTYRYVKRKVTNGNLEILCIPDIQKMVLKKAKSEYGNSTNDLSGNNKNSSRSGTQKTFSGSDYISLNANDQIDQCTNIASIQNGTYLNAKSETFIEMIAKPPQSRA
jgi:hypothetical protein